jgi:hypothetical protein
MTKAKAYYTMIVRTPGQLWHPEFGDYDREVVKQEMDDQIYSMRLSQSWPKGTKFKIIKTLETQSSITSQVEIENLTARKA